MKKLTSSILTELIQPRPENSHKGNFGRIVLIGGNNQFGGAIIMSTQAAIGTGAGLTTVVTEEKNHAPLHARCPEAMVVNLINQEEISALLPSANVVLIGPGLGVDSSSQQLLELVLKQQSENQWLVIDGSAITLFAKKWLPLNYPHHIIFTPHQMEWQRLSGIPIAEQTEMKNQSVQQQLNTNIVLKSHRTEIYTEKNHYQNPIGTPAMATGGMGDTLSGIITGFLAQFEEKEIALIGAVYLHSYIGEELGKKNYVVLPTRISEQIPVYMKYFETHH
ncbi:NAD(P)H-hydrate dehydratase [Melissococcus plutonius]|uniref:NAD(P)H-hydrate dehydratase n=1 Tax=Melissococcus plutonius TaxID=33970 RepID=UPI003C30D65A